MTDDPELLYSDRRLSAGFPGLADRAIETYRATVAARPEERGRVETLVSWLARLIDLERRRRFLLVGCGPEPTSMSILRDAGFEVVGVDPVAAVLGAARAYLRDDEAVLAGSAEALPVTAESQDVVLLESVLEHVDSVGKSLAEAHRVLAPGGVAYIITTNRHELRENLEYNVRRFQWLPDVVKESYVFRHLHYDPSLANYAERPAVHWFTYGDLCKAGREAGFFQFYSHLDLKEAEPANFSGDELVRRLKARIVAGVQRSAWLRAAALTQFGGQIFMLKRP